MNLSKHFTLAEFLRSETAIRHDIEMTPPDSVLANLDRLANEVLEPIRAAAMCSIHINSGYRPMELNRLVGGSSNSDHMYGRAADIIAPDLELRAFARIARHACGSLPVAKLLVEFSQWLHVSIEPLGSLPRREFLVASREAGKTVYKPWEVA
ncbi:MAG TPA: D-Ala-D-Ala carboxypeptidase family metallohydrolase [Gammaproteobacteria bacterium]